MAQSWEIHLVFRQRCQELVKSKPELLIFLDLGRKWGRKWVRLKGCREVVFRGNHFCKKRATLTWEFLYAMNRQSLPMFTKWAFLPCNKHFLKTEKYSCCFFSLKSFSRFISIVNRKQEVNLTYSLCFFFFEEFIKRSGTCLFSPVFRPAAGAEDAGVLFAFLCLLYQNPDEAKSNNNFPLKLNRI